MTARPDLMPRQNFVYFARNNRSGLVKIGFSHDPNKRLSGIRSGGVDSITILFTTPGGRDKEQSFHRRFADCRQKGEWFREEGALQKYLAAKGVAYKKQEAALAVDALPAAASDTRKSTIPTYPRTIGYARVSTEDQSLDMQTAALREAGVADEDMFVEKLSAVNAKRPQFRVMMKSLWPGDTLVVYSTSRLARDLPTLHQIVKQLEADGVTLRSITEPQLNTKTATGRLMFNITGAFDQFERDKIRERTSHGMQELKRQGMSLGRPTLANDDMRQRVGKFRKPDGTWKKSVAAIAKDEGVSASTIYGLFGKKART